MTIISSAGTLLSASLAEERLREARYSPKLASAMAAMATIGIIALPERMIAIKPDAARADSRRKPLRHPFKADLPASLIANPVLLAWGVLRESPLALAIRLLRRL
jgi:hypothetical protein